MPAFTIIDNTTDRLLVGDLELIAAVESHICARKISYLIVSRDDFFVISPCTPTTVIKDNPRYLTVIDTTGRFLSGSVQFIAAVESETLIAGNNTWLIDRPVSTPERSIITN